MDLITGLATGMLFGVFLQKAQVLRYDRQVGAMRLLDMTIFKFMLSAIIVGALGIYLLKDLGLATLSLKSTAMGAQVFGGLIFGIGWGLLGYCPGTVGGALGEGRLDGLWGILGMLFGGAVYAALHPWFKANLIPMGSLGEVTVPALLGFNHWLVILVFAVVCLTVFRYFERKGL